MTEEEIMLRGRGLVLLVNVKAFLSLRFGNVKRKSKLRSSVDIQRDHGLSAMIMIKSLFLFLVCFHCTPFASIRDT